MFPNWSYAVRCPGRRLCAVYRWENQAHTHACKFQTLYYSTPQPHSVGTFYLGHPPRETTASGRPAEQARPAEPRRCPSRAPPRPPVRGSAHPPAPARRRQRPGPPAGSPAAGGLRRLPEPLPASAPQVGEQKPPDGGRRLSPCPRPAGRPACVSAAAGRGPPGRLAGPGLPSGAAPAGPRTDRG